MSTNNTVEDLREEIRAMKDHMTHLGREAGHDARERASRWSSIASDSLCRAGGQARNFVRERPGSTLLGAAIVGAIIGTVVSLFCCRNSD